MFQLNILNKTNVISKYIVQINDILFQAILESTVAR